MSTYSLDRLLAMMEGSDCDNCDDHGIKSDAEIKEEAQDVEPEDAENDYEDAKRDLAKECGDLAVNSESASVAIDLAALACCESYIYRRADKYEINSVLEGVIGDAWRKIKEWFKKLWEKIKQWANKLKMYIYSFFMDSQKFLTKYSDELDDKYHLLDDAKIRMEIYDTKIFENARSAYNTIKKDLSDLIKKIKDLGPLAEKSGTGVNNTAGGVTLYKTNTATGKLESSGQFEAKCEEIERDIDAINKTLDKENKVKKFSAILTSSIAKANIQIALKEIEEANKTFNDNIESLNVAVSAAEKETAKLEAHAKDNEELNGPIFKCASKLTSALGKVAGIHTKANDKRVKVGKLIVSQAVAIARRILGRSPAKEGYYRYSNGYSSTTEGSLLNHIMTFI